MTKCCTFSSLYSSCFGTVLREREVWSVRFSPGKKVRSDRGSVGSSSKVSDCWRLAKDCSADAPVVGVDSRHIITVIGCTFLSPPRTKRAPFIVSCSRVFNKVVCTKSPKRWPVPLRSPFDSRFFWINKPRPRPLTRRQTMYRGQIRVTSRGGG